MGLYQLLLTSACPQATAQCGFPAEALAGVYGALMERHTPSVFLTSTTAFTHGGAAALDAPTVLY